MTGFQPSLGRRDLDRTLGTLLNLEANLELLTDSIQRQYECFRGTQVHSHRRMGRGARRWGWGTEVCVVGVAVLHTCSISSALRDNSMK